MYNEKITFLQEEAKRLIQNAISILEMMSKEPNIIIDSTESDNVFQTFDKKIISKEIEILTGELFKLDNLELVLAVVGTMKAGKSTTINAIVGSEVLPNRNRPMTALPTLIKHTPNKKIPVLKIKDNTSLNTLIKELSYVIKKLNDENDIKLRSLEKDPDMKGLISFINDKKHISKEYENVDNIFWFLKTINDLVRLSTSLEVKFPFADYDEIHEIPIIEIEFSHLTQDKQLGGTLVLLDTPGPNESGQKFLRKMMVEQLQKASAILAVLDFTQLKSDADAEVRDQLKKIAQISKNRMYALVNKFDQKDRHGDDQAQVKSFIANDLLSGVISIDNIFPVSSRWGYLANRAKKEVKYHNKLPDYNKEAWVADFAEEAFGRRWKDNIENTEEVLKAAEELWEDSLFDVLLENVIKESHTRASAYTIESATSKAVYCYNKINNFLEIRETSLKRSKTEIQSHIVSLKNDLDIINQHHIKSKEAVKETLNEIKKETARAFKEIKLEAENKIDFYFREGKRLELEQLEKDTAKTKQELDKNFVSELINTFKNKELSKSENFGIDAKKNDFAPNSTKLKFDNKEDALLLLDKINKVILFEIKHAELKMSAIMEPIINYFSKNFIDNIKESTKSILSNMNKRFTDDGFSIELNLPKILNINLNYSADEILSDIINEKTKTVKKQKRQSGFWGTLADWFSASDMGWEEYEEHEEWFEIDISKVRESVMGSMENAFNNLSEEFYNHVEIPLDEEVNKFFNEFKNIIEGIEGDLTQSIKDREKSEIEQEEISQKLSNCHKYVPYALADINILTEEINILLKKISLNNA